MNLSPRDRRLLLLLALAMPIVLATDYYSFPRVDINSSERVGFLITDFIADAGVYFFCWIFVGLFSSQITHSWFGRHATVSIILVFLILVSGPFAMDSIVQAAGFTGFSAMMLSRIGRMAIWGSGLSSMCFHKTRLKLTLAPTTDPAPLSIELTAKQTERAAGQAG
jgi:hypothetical protein